MARWDVRFQVQVGRNNLESVTYHSDRGPCTEREALECLGRLWAKSKDYYSNSSWNSKLKDAIEKAERAVKNGRNASAQAQRNFYSKEFDHEGRTYRVDVAIEAGDGHFN